MISAQRSQRAPAALWLPALTVTCRVAARGQALTVHGPMTPMASRLVVLMTPSVTESCNSYRRASGRTALGGRVSTTAIHHVVPADCAWWGERPAPGLAATGSVIRTAGARSTTPRC